MKKDFLSLIDFTQEELLAFVTRSAELKALRKKGETHQPLRGKTLGMIFNKPSTRTRISFEVGMFDLGGHSLFLTSDQLQLNRGESVKDSAKVLSRYLDGILIRTFDHHEVLELAENADVPVINGLTDLNHPVQILADLLTIREKINRIEGVKVAYIGDGNNVTYSWMMAASILNMDLRVASPPGYRLDKPENLGSLGTVELMDDPYEAVKDADVIYADVWVSMGQENETDAKKSALKNYQINKDLVAAAGKNVLVMHCLPAHREEEITSEVLDGPHSVVFDQAENRLHTQKAILEKLLSNGTR